MAIDTHRPARDRGDDLRSTVRSRDAGQVLLTLSGEISGGPATDRLSATVRRLVPDPDVRELVIDLADVTYLSSVGLARLLLIRQELEAIGVTLRLANPRGQVLDKLQVTGLAPVLLGNT